MIKFIPVRKEFFQDSSRIRRQVKALSGFLVPPIKEVHDHPVRCRSYELIADAMALR